MATKYVGVMKGGSCCKSKPLAGGNPGEVLTLDLNGDPFWAVAGAPALTNLARFFSVDTPLAANTPYTVNHNLNLTSANGYMLTARDVTDGSSVEVTIVSSTVNSLVVKSNIAMANVRLAIVGS